MSGATLSTVSVGALLPHLDVSVDRTFIVAAAIASQDFEDVHHDPAAAKQRGTPDIFISINSTNGLVDRYVTDWGGPATRISSVSLRLGMPLFPGDTLRLRGEVTAVENGLISVRVTGTHSRGTHVTAVVTLGELRKERS